MIETTAKPVSGLRGADGATHLVARIGPYQLAIPLGVILSLHEAPLVFAVPCAQPGIAGAIRYQGLAVPVFDLRRSLRLEQRPVQPDDRLILVAVRGRIMALIADEVRTFVAIERMSDEREHALFGDTPVNRRIIAGIAAAPFPCAVLDPDGLILPDEWPDDVTSHVYAQPPDPQHPLWRRTELLAEVPAPPAVGGLEAAVFRIGGQFYAVPVTSVAEFFTGAVHAPIPVRAPVAASLLNRRGSAVLLIDPRPLLDLPPAPLPPAVDGMVLADTSGNLAIATDSLEGLRELPAARAGHQASSLCTSLHPTPEGPVIMLDVPAVIRHAYTVFAGRPKAGAPST